METKFNYLSGSFKDRKSAERAYNRLKEKGYTDEEIDIMMSDATRAKFFKKNEDEGLGSKVNEGAGAGSAIEGVLEALVGAGMPKDRAEKHKKNISEGNIVVNVTPRGEDHSILGHDWTMYDASDVY